jgi:hypothetical protein
VRMSFMATIAMPERAAGILAGSLAGHRAVTVAPRAVGSERRRR